MKMLIGAYQEVLEKVDKIKEYHLSENLFAIYQNLLNFVKYYNSTINSEDRYSTITCFEDIYE